MTKHFLPHPHHVITCVMWALLFGLLIWAVVVTVAALILTLA